MTIFTVSYKTNKWRSHKNESQSQVSKHDRWVTVEAVEDDIVGVHVDVIADWESDAVELG